MRLCPSNPTHKVNKKCLKYLFPEFEKGSITWDDRNKKPINKGNLPDGEFSESGKTRIDYCCRKDGLASSAIFLPIDKPFYLLRYGGQCQNVHGMTVVEETAHWDDSEFMNKSTKDGSHPDDTASDSDHKLHYCYYAKHSGSAVLSGNPGGFLFGIGKSLVTGRK